jgi:hypothetical protein
MALTEYACPSCDQTNPGQIDYAPGMIKCSRNPAHTWRDTDEFAKLRPVKKFTVAKPTFAPQQGHVKMQVMVPGGVQQELEKAWGDKLEATITGVLTMMAEGQVMIVPKSDLQRMKERLGKIPESSAELFGLIYALGQQRDDAVADADILKQEIAAYEGRSVGCVLVNLGDQYQAAADRARSQEPPEPLKWFIERNVKNAIAESWF